MPTLVLEHGDRPGSSGILGEALRAYGHKLRFVMVGAGEGLPSDLDDVDGIVATDGSHTLGVHAPAWAPRVMDLLAAAQARSLPIVGLGLGARLLSKALGGEVSSGGECEWIETKLVYAGREDPMYAGIAWTSQQFYWQSESITKLPTGATMLAQSGKLGKNPAIRAFAAGVFAFGFENRWELDSVLFEHQLSVRSSELTAMGTMSDRLRAAWREHGEMSMRIGRRMAESVALFLMPVERRSVGRVKDLHY